MRSRLRQVLPPWHLILVFAITFLILEGPILYLEWKQGFRARDLKVRPAWVLIGLASIAYGGYRVVGFHPFYRIHYCKWLEFTPWTVRKPLPLGPVVLAWQDGIILGGLMLLTLTQPIPGSIRVLDYFLIAHCLFLTATFWFTGVAELGYLCAFGLAGTIRYLHQPWICFGVAALLYLAAYEGLWQSLERFPWKNTSWPWSEALENGDWNSRLGQPCGWPYDRLLRDVVAAERWTMRLPDKILVSMLAGWWVFCIGTQIRSAAGESLAILLFPMSMVVLPVARLTIYLLGYSPPLTFWGRVRTGRLLIPGYDRCFIGPILAVLFGGLLFLGLSGRVPEDIAASTALSVVLLITLTAPPGLREWRLTGAHRITPGALAQGVNAPFIEVG